MSFHQPDLPDITYIKCMSRIQSILALTSQEVEQILGGAITPILHDHVRERIHTLIEIVQLQDIGWNYASYPQMRPSFADGMRRWFTLPIPELGHMSPLAVLLTDGKEGIGRVRAYLRDHHYDDTLLSDMAGTYRSTTDGHEIKYL